MNENWNELHWTEKYLKTKNIVLFFKINSLLVEINNLYEDVKFESGQFLPKCPCLQVCSKTKYIVYDEISSIYQGLRHPFLESVVSNYFKKQSK